uniref:Uncharacterized protein n=1 Tax=Oryza glumipatula TaxID=40148 RepID=A0A0E0B1T4_9ORYZ
MASCYHGSYRVMAAQVLRNETRVNRVMPDPNQPVNKWKKWFGLVYFHGLNVLSPNREQTEA